RIAVVGALVVAHEVHHDTSARMDLNTPGPFDGLAVLVGPAGLERVEVVLVGLQRGGFEVPHAAGLRCLFAAEPELGILRNAHVTKGRVTWDVLVLVVERRVALLLVLGHLAVVVVRLVVRIEAGVAVIVAGVVVPGVGARGIPTVVAAVPRHIVVAAVVAAP